MKHALSAIVFLCTACGAQERAPESARVSIGTSPSDGSALFVPLDDGQDVVLSPGAQGGFHVFINLRLEVAALADNTSLVIERSARRADTDQLVSTAEQRANFVPAPEAGWVDTESTMVMFLCPVPVGISVADETLVVKVRAFSDAQAIEPLAEGTLQLRPRCPQDEQANFCQRICYAR